jgi:hypothetical protein
MRLAPIRSAVAGTGWPASARWAAAANLWVAIATASAGFTTGVPAATAETSPSAVSGRSVDGSNSRFTTTSTSGSRSAPPAVAVRARFSALSHRGWWPRSATALQMAFVSLLLWRLNTPTRTSSLIVLPTPYSTFRWKSEYRPSHASTHHYTALHTAAHFSLRTWEKVVF